MFAAANLAGQGRATGPAGGNLSGDDADAVFALDGAALWGLKLTELGTGPRLAIASA